MDKRRENHLNFVCISPAPWDNPIWTNRQHIMEKFAEKHKVLYVFHPPYLRSSIKRNIFKNKFKKISMVKKISNNLSIFNPFVIPFANESLRIHQINIKFNVMFLRKILKQLKYDEYVLWFYDPEGVDYLTHLEPKLSCYDCVDEYSTMPFYNSIKRKKRLEYLERELIKKCDLIFTTSENLYEKKKKINLNTFLVENVGDFDHFNKVERMALQVPADFPNIESPIIGFIGALDDYKVDFDLIEYLARNRPDWAIILIGSKMNSNEKKKILPTRSNIYYLGMKEYEKLPNYIAKFNVCIIPYRINNYTKHVFPIKFYEFLATGKPVITTALPSLKKYKDIIGIADSYDGFISEIEKALYNDNDDFRKKRLDIAKLNTWELRRDKLLSHVYEKIGSTRR